MLAVELLEQGRLRDGRFPDDTAFEKTPPGVFASASHTGRLTRCLSFFLRRSRKELEERPVQSIAVFAFVR